MNTELLNQLLQLTVWLPIEGYDNYEVSICGQVRNVHTKRVLRPGISNVGYYYIILHKKGNTKPYTIHRLVANAFLPNLDNKKCVDHIDSNKLNNTISNLRWASYRDNNQNASLSSKNTSGVKGVTFNKKKNKWQAQIMFNYKSIHIGCFDSIEDAKNARQKKAIELFGEFLNRIEK